MAGEPLSGLPCMIFLSAVGRHFDHCGAILFSLGDLILVVGVLGSSAGQHPGGGAGAAGERGRGGERRAQERRRDRRRTHARLRPEAGE